MEIYGARGGVAWRQLLELLFPLFGGIIMVNYDMELDA